MLKDIDKYILGITDTPNISIVSQSLNTNLTEYENVKNIIKKRNRNSHKGTYGRVGILSGSKGMAGAAVLNCNAALRSGSGLVKAFITEPIYNIVESMSIEAITYTFDELHISFDELDRELIQFSDVIATGSGCANMKRYRDILEFLLENSSKPLVIDAEGINVLNLDTLKNHRQNIILTPHYGEMAKLIKKDTDFFKENIIDKAAEFANKYNVYLVLKGARTVLACPDGYNYINTTGNPGMATAGSGDVLTGVIAAFIGQKIEITEALRAAVYIHGLAGDIGSSFIGEHSLIAGDIVRYLPEAIKKIIR
ncbi:MAG: NAD(P)H-hydrate dehydratase [Clostridiaceae bacterium]|nr:NAD(P)H-hydrate dehydratase [Clostridiaceae bacterium]